MIYLKKNMLFMLAFLTPSIAMTEEDIPYPQLDPLKYCSLLVSKMLDPNEKNVELKKCVELEEFLKEAMLPYWSLVPIKGKRRLIEQELTHERAQTYQQVYKHVGRALSDACLTGEKLICRMR